MFRVQDHTESDKQFRIINDVDVELFVDYDDVDHETTDVVVEEVVRILNEHWDQSRVQPQLDAIYRRRQEDSDSD